MTTQKFLFGVIFLWTVLPASLFAKITLDPDFKGTVVITSPDGELILLEPGDEVPDIVPGSTVEVFDGSATLHTEANDSIQASCLGNDFAVAAGDAASLSCGEETGSLKAIKGAIEATDPDGKTFEIAEGVEHAIKSRPGEPKKAPPAAAGEPPGGPPAEGALGETDVPDSRSLEASPSQ